MQLFPNTNVQSNSALEPSSASVGTAAAGNVRAKDERPADTLGEIDGTDKDFATTLAEQGGKPAQSGAGSAKPLALELKSEFKLDAQDALDLIVPQASEPYLDVSVALEPATSALTEIPETMVLESALLPESVSAEMYPLDAPDASGLGPFKHLSSQNIFKLTGSQESMPLAQSNVALPGGQVNYSQLAGAVTERINQAISTPSMPTVEGQVLNTELNAGLILSDKEGQQLSAASQPLTLPGAPLAVQANKLLVSNSAKDTLSELEGLVKNLKPSDEFELSTEAEKNSLGPELRSFSSSLRSELVASELQTKPALQVQFGRAQWTDAVGQHVLQLAAKNLNFAEIQLDPPELGPLQVRVHVLSDQATVSFSSQSALVREQLEQSQARLKDFFAGEGMNLVDVDVRDQQQQGDRLRSQADDGKETSVAEVESDERVLETQLSPLTSAAWGVDELA